MLNLAALSAVAGDEDMQDVQEQQDAHVANGHEKQGQQQQSGQQEQQGGQQDGQGGKKSGPRKIELDKPSGKVCLCVTIGS